ncbi:MAG: DUF86 domain-containing protein [Eubacterium sp.]|nr:DUF86 domain-containing protein [Eubacterium sp.]
MLKINERDKDYLLNILDHCDRIEAAINRFGNSEETFMNDADYRDVIKMNLFQIGEAVNQLTQNFKEEISDIPWHQMYGIRNIIAHAYVKVDEEIVWSTAAKDVPALKSRLERILLL